METVFNLDNIQETNFINEEGDHTLKITNFETKQVNEKLVHSFTCINRDKQSVKLDLFITEKAMFRYKQLLKALGHDAKGTIDVSEVSPKLVGKYFIGTLKRKAPKYNAATNTEEPSKYFDIVDFKPYTNA